MVARREHWILLELELRGGSEPLDVSAGIQTLYSVRLGSAFNHGHPASPISPLMLPIHFQIQPSFF